MIIFFARKREFLGGGAFFFARKREKNFWCFLGAFLGVFLCFFGVFCFCFSRVSAKCFGGLFFAMSQTKPGISALEERVVGRAPKGSGHGHGAGPKNFYFKQQKQCTET